MPPPPSDLGSPSVSPVIARASSRLALALAGVVLAGGSAIAAPATYYVAPAGDDGAAGSMDAPFATIARAQMAAAAGDTVYFRAGTYAYKAGMATCKSGTDTINGITLNKSGSSGNPIRYWAYQNEIPVFDFSGIKDSCRVKGFDVTGNWIHLKGLEVRGVPQNNMMNHESWGVWVSGSNNTFELLNLHHNMGPGLFIQNGGNNLVLNCDSHHNYDPMTSNGAGQSADGFGAHISAGNTGNVFRGCRAWWNSDDGFDLINAFEVVVIENSWAWYHGYLPDTMTAVPDGNGNGFKAGGYGTDTSKFPAKSPQHVVRQCLSFQNKAAGFYANHHPGPVTFNNNTGYNNKPNFNLLGMDASGADIHVGVLRNNLAFMGTAVSNDSGTDEKNNSWTLSGITVAASDFESTAITGLDGPRQADGSLPVVPFMRLAAGSDLIDKGVDVMLPFTGTAPDLGAFEYGASGGSGAGGATATGGISGSGGGRGQGGAVGGGGATGRGGGAGGAPSSGSGGRASGGGAGPASSGGAPMLGSGGGPAASGGGPASSGGASNSGAIGGGSGGKGGAIAASGGASGSGAGVPEDGGNGGCSCATGAAGATTETGAVASLVGLALLVARPARRRQGKSRVRASSVRKSTGGVN